MYEAWQVNNVTCGYAHDMLMSYLASTYSFLYKPLVQWPKKLSRYTIYWMIGKKYFFFEN